MKRPSWAIRVLFAGGQTVFLRKGGIGGGMTGSGPILTFYDKAQADNQAALLRQRLDTNDIVTAIQRSHCRRSRVNL